MRYKGADRMSLYYRLGITLVILGMVQSFAPTSFRPTRASLRVAGRLKIANALPDLINDSATFPVTAPTLTSESGPDQEADQESHDTEDLAETFTWSEAITVRRMVPRFTSVVTLGPVSKLGLASEKVRSALHQSRMDAIVASSSANMTARLCRITC